MQPPNEVLAQIQEFFGDCSVVEIHELPDTCLLEAGAHKQVKGKPTYASLLLQWQSNFDRGDPAAMWLEFFPVEGSAQEQAGTRIF